MKKGYFASNLTLLLLCMARPLYGLDFDVPDSTNGHVWLNKLGLLAMFATLAGTMMAQVQTLADHELQDPMVKTVELDQVFRQYEVVKFPIRRLYNEVNAPEFDQQVDWQLGSHRLQGKLVLHDVRSADYSLELLTDHGVVEVDQGACSTYRGVSTSGGEIRLTITDNNISGFFTNEEGKEIYIQPAGEITRRNTPGHLIYKEEDVIRDPLKRCGSTHRHRKSPQKTSSSSPQHSRAATCVQAQVAIAADYQLYKEFGNNANAVQNYLLNLKNLQEDSYDFYPIRFQVVKVVIATSDQADPWTDSEVANDLLDDFCCWAGTGNSNQLNCSGSNGFGITHDLGELWTGRTFNGSTVGVAWVGTVCNSMFRYSVNQYLSTVDENRVLISHEQGHNFGAGHVTGEYIMGSYVDPDAVNFTIGNQNLISAEVGSVSCLSGCSGANTNCPGTVTVQNSTATGNHRAGTRINTSGSINLNGNAMYDAPTVEINSGFTVGVGKTFEIRSQGCN